MDISHAGSNAPIHVEPTRHVEGSDRKFGAASNDVAASLASGSFTTFFTWRGNGVHPRLRFAHSAINPNSKVFVSLSEFSSDERINRFIGAAKMTVSNV